MWGGGEGPRLVLSGVVTVLYWDGNDFVATWNSPVRWEYSVFSRSPRSFADVRSWLFMATGGTGRFFTEQLRYGSSTKALFFLPGKYRSKLQRGTQQ